LTNFYNIKTNARLGLETSYCLRGVVENRKTTLKPEALSPLFVGGDQRSGVGSRPRGGDLAAEGIRLNARDNA
jgi:hypothetical protein